MSHSPIPDFRPQLKDWRNDLALLRQNPLQNESAFLKFTKERGLPVRGVISGDPSDFHERGWLAGDGIDHDGKPLFHPFRLYPCSRILKLCELPVTASSTLGREKALNLMEWALAQLPTDAQFAEVTHRCNRVVDLAILLEPVYWPSVIGRQTFPAGMREADLQSRLGQYHQRLIAFVKELDAAQWRRIHEELRLDAAWMDANAELHVLLRLCNWHRRERLRGAISGALWIRHLAEVIRRGFKEAHQVEWPEEDRAFGSWAAGGRQAAFGSDRPFDDVLRAKPYVAYQFGLFTGSAVRWYVEGETEYYAILEILPEPARYGIELVNLHGNLQSGRNNAAFKLQAGLAEDRALRRFSVVSFDRDVAANVKILQRQVRLDNVVGLIAGHDPDFEFANFAVEELVEIAACLDETLGFDGIAVRQADWTGISGGRAFEKKYAAVSETKRSGLKGEAWGIALARYAMQYPRRQTDGGERPLWLQIRAAIHAWNSNYDFQRERFTFDPVTLEQLPRPQRQCPATP